MFTSDLKIVVTHAQPDTAMIWWNDKQLGSIVETGAKHLSREWTVYKGSELWGTICAGGLIGAELELKAISGEHIMMVRLSRKASLHDMIVAIGNTLSFAWVLGRRLFEPVGDFVVPQCPRLDLDEEQKRLSFAVQVAFRCVYFRSELEQMS